MTDSLSPLHLVWAAGRPSFGVGHVATSLATAQRALGSDAHLWSLDTEDEADWVSTTFGLERHALRIFPWSGPAFLKYSRQMQAAAISEAGDVGVVHVHGAWSGCSHIANRMRRRHQMPVVVAPHGTLQPWALNKATWKKRLASLVYERENLREAACLHALAPMELADCRHYGLRNPIALIPNGVSQGWLDSTGEGEHFREQFGISADRRILLFLSRITPKKGLPLLLEALDQQRHLLGDWLVVIAGADEFDHLREVQALTAQRKLQRHVLFPGPLYNQTKRDAFAAAEAFVLPSWSEGAPIAVLEGLGAGIPVLATKGSPWEDLVTWEAGWWTDVSADALSDALADLLPRAPADLRRMGQNGLALIHDRYLWSHQARKTLGLYRWLRGSAEKPDFVITD